MLVEEIIFIVCCSEVIFCTTLSTERFAIADLLKVIRTAGDTLVAVAVEGVQVDAGSAVNAGIHFRAFKDRLSVRIHDARSRSAVGIDEVAVLISLIIRSLQITVTKRCFDCSKGRNRLAVTLQLTLAFFVGCLDRLVDLCDGCGIRLRDNEGDTVLRCSTVD